MTNHKILGGYGEQLAADYLKRHDYKIIAKNYRIGRFEFDLISTKPGQIIFWEIKTRNKATDFFRDTLITKQQISNLRKGISAYCAKNRINLDAAHLDMLVILINQSTKLVRFKHYQDIL